MVSSKNLEIRELGILGDLDCHAVGIFERASEPAIVIGGELCIGHVKCFGIKQRWLPKVILCSGDRGIVIGGELAIVDSHVPFGGDVQRGAIKILCSHANVRVKAITKWDDNVIKIFNLRVRR